MLCVTKKWRDFIELTPFVPLQGETFRVNPSLNKRGEKGVSFIIAYT